MLPGRRCMGFAVGLGVFMPWLAFAGDSATDAEAARAGVFRREIAPILVSRCLTCHSSKLKKGGLDLSTRGSALAGGSSGEAAIVPGKPAESELLAKLEAGEMPPKNPLAKDRIEAIRAWIAAGADYDREPLKPGSADASALWSLRPIARPTPPPVKNAAWPRNAIDQFILAKLEHEGIEPVPLAGRHVLIRRATLDLTGLPPTPQEIEAFLNDTRADAYERLIDRLLASPHYGERWGRHWLDVVRFGESHGYETNMPRYNAWPYRDYVIRAFNQDLPYADFVRDQLAGDVAAGDGLAKAATGFLVAGTHDGVGNATREGMLQQRNDDLDDVIAATSSTFLGLTVQCARCHDHKFDPIPQRDYYALQAVFAGVKHGDRAIALVPEPDRTAERSRVSEELGRLEDALDALEPLAQSDARHASRAAVDPLHDVDRFEPVLVRYVRFEIMSTNDGNEPCIDELEVRGPGRPGVNLASAAQGAKASASSEYPGNSRHKVVHLNDGRESNERSWISNEKGKGWAQVELARPARVDRVIWSRDRTGVYRDRLAVSYKVEVAAQPGRWRVVASSADRVAYGAGKAATSRGCSQETRALIERRAWLRERAKRLATDESVYAGIFDTPEPTHLLARGDPSQPQGLVVPASLSSLSPRFVLDQAAPDVERRRALASWLADPANPLPLRVLANRIWQYHFGLGLVATPNDFGSLGAPPSHPELLDWLAREIERDGGRIKPLHRLIMLSSTYQQSTMANPRGQARDAMAALRWRYPPRRLEAEAIRDAILFTSGDLNPAIGGPSYTVWAPNTNYVAVYNALPRQGPATFRRMVYQLRPRGRLDDTFGVFDCPDAAQTTPRRTVSTTAPQALALWNSEFVLERATALAERARSQAGADPSAQVRWMFMTTLGRAPTDRERTGAVALVEHDSPAALGRVLYNSSEFLTLP